MEACASSRHPESRLGGRLWHRPRGPQLTSYYKNPSGWLWLECRQELRNHGVGWMRAVERLRKRKKRDNPREGWEDDTGHAATTGILRRGVSVVLAVAHPNPWSSASFYLPSQSLADSRCNLHADLGSSHSRRSPSCRFLLCRVALVCLVLRRRRRLPIPCSRGFSRLSAQLCPPAPRGIFRPLDRVYRALLAQGRLF